MKRIFLFRHAESQANLGAVTEFPSEIELTERGERQAKELADSINEAPDVIVLSSFRRTHQTAKPLIEKFPNSGVIELPVHEFTYLSQSRCGRSSAQERRPMVEEYWTKSDPFYVDGGASESLEGLSDRVRRFLHEIANMPEDTIFIFTHHQFLLMTIWEILSPNRIIDRKFMVGFKQFYDSLHIPNAAKVNVRYCAGSFYVGKIDSSHLIKS